VERKTATPLPGQTAKTAVAALLAAVLLASALLSANHALHQLLHQDNGGKAHLCLICSLAKGQVSGAEAAAISVVFVLSWMGILRHFNSALIASFDYQLSPSRGPPDVFLQKRL
jgi:hypothetical protein